MFYSPHKEDSDSKWGIFLNEKQWNALKNNIDSYVDFFKTLKEDGK